MGKLSRLFGIARHDGGATALETPATGIPPGVLDGALAAARNGGRRDRPLASPPAVLTQAIAGKVLLGWLQNRHQTLYPLTVNMGALEPDQVRLLARMMAVALQSGAAPAEVAPAAAWFESAGGDAAAVRGALAAPPPLSTLVRDLKEANIAAYAYVVALASGAWRDPAGRLFLEYLATRLDLPIEVVRSANRRYRR
jgi:uncharacterized membrane protein YebE (DUF533 family)